MAPSSFKKIGAAVAYAAAVRAATESYILSEEYTADNFFEKFDFFESTYTSGDSWDDTHGYVRYRTQADAESLGLISTSNGQIYLGPDTNSTYDPDGKGRDSIRMTSKATYNQGLMIAKFSHLPVQACGAWPAFWSFADPWLTTGEIDYYEGWDLVGYNRIAMHTNETLAGSCTLTSTGIEGKVMTEDCNQVDGGAGCGVKDDSGVWGSVTGATFAMEWTDSAIKIWNWLPSAVPADVAAGSPDPSSGDWGSPTLLVEQTNCDLNASFANQQLVFDIDFCGDTAGSPTFWNATCSAFGDSCAAYVAENPAAFSELYFMVEGIQFYEMGVAAATTSASSSAVAPATTSATSSALLGGLVPGLGSVLDSTIGATATLSSAATSNTVLAVAPTETHSHSTGYVYATSTSTDESGSETTVVVVVDTTICPITASEAAATSSSSPATGTDDVVAAQSTPVPAASSQTGAVAVPSSSAAPSPSDATLTSHLTSTSTEMTTSTIFSTSSSTITSCASTASASCSVGEVTTVVIAVSTTICPVTAAEASSSASANGTTLIAASSTGVSVPAASGPAASLGSATSGNSPVEATPAASSGTGAGSSTITTTKASSSSSAATTSINPSSTEVISTTDVSGELETASGTLVLATATATGAAGAYNAGAAGNGTATAATAATSATQSNTCSGLDCIVVSNGAGKTGAGAVGASGIALVVLAGAMFLF